LSPSLRRAALAGLAWLALFSVLFTVGDELGAWPTLPPGAFRDVDLYTGLLAGLLLFILLVRPFRAPATPDT
jgi:hypothetical protein